MTMNYLIFGRNSWLGQKIANTLTKSGHTVLISQVDITNLADVRQEIKAHNVDAVINSAGRAGNPNIDWCEDHKAETLASNTVGPINILTACLESGKYMVHLGSGCIFDNAGYDTPVTEETKASPPSFYSYTKFWADEVLKNFPVLILRLRMPSDADINPRNLITKLSKYPKIIDVQNSMTVVDDFLVAFQQLTDKRKIGIYNIVNPGVITHKEIMAMYTELVDQTHKYEMIPAQDLQRLGLAKAGRSNCVLSTDKLTKEGIHLRPVKEAMRDVMQKYATNFKAAKSS